MEKFIKAQFDATTRTMRAWTERNFVEFWTYTQEEYDEYVTYEHLLEYISGATELPEGYESYEEWADQLWQWDYPENILLDLSYCCQWDDICRLAGVDPKELPYGSCCTVGPANWHAA